jgi:hypothetical protein
MQRRASMTVLKPPLLGIIWARTSDRLGDATKPCISTWGKSILLAVFDAAVQVAYNCHPVLLSRCFWGDPSCHVCNKKACHIGMGFELQYTNACFILFKTISRSSISIVTAPEGLSPSKHYLHAFNRPWFSSFLSLRVFLGGGVSPLNEPCERKTTFSPVTMFRLVIIVPFMR